MKICIIGAWGTNVGAVSLSLGAIAAAVALEASGSNAYAFVLGEVNPIILTVVTCLLGLVALRMLDAYDWFRPAGGTRQGYVVALSLGAVLPVPMPVVDVFGGFPPRINVLAPDAFLFYPAMAVVAEFVLHAVPLALVLLSATLVATPDDRARTVAIAVAALPEPILQVAWGAAQSPAWATACVGVQLLLFNLIGLRLFRRHGFLAVYLYRLAYYAVWHTMWGHLRLDILFG